jgi:hydrogenase maturation protease
MKEWEWHLLEDKPPLEKIAIGGVELKPGDRVRLRPRKGGDVLDIALEGKQAVIESIEQDYEGQIHVCVVVDDDPGRDIGMMRQPGHRFFFNATEIEPISPDAPLKSASIERPTILIACIGNIFMGDDAFGVEVAKRLASCVQPEGVRVIDFGIRGLDLAYTLIDGTDITILVDACPRGGSAGDLYVVEPDLASDRGRGASPAALDAHNMNPMNVIRAAQTMGGPLKKVLLLGCEPESLGPEEGYMGLSEAVSLAVERAVPLLESIVKRLLDGEWPLKESELS